MEDVVSTCRSHHKKNVICVVESTLTFACGVHVESNVPRNKILNRVARDEVAVHCLPQGDPKQMLGKKL